MAGYATCAGCFELRQVSAGRKDEKERKFFFCALGRSNGNLGWASRPVIEFAPAELDKPSVPVPAWCGRRKGERV